MKHKSSYAAYLEECLLLTLTSAAFYINAAQKHESKTLSSMLVQFSDTLIKNAERISEMLMKTNAPLLNPSHSLLPTGDHEKDMETARACALKLQSRLLFLCAYAPNASKRQTLLKIAIDVGSIINRLVSNFI